GIQKSEYNKIQHTPCSNTNNEDIIEQTQSINSDEFNCHLLNHIENLTKQTRDENLTKNTPKENSPENGSQFDNETTLGQNIYNTTKILQNKNRVKFFASLSNILGHHHKNPTEICELESEPTQRRISRKKQNLINELEFLVQKHFPLKEEIENNNTKRTELYSIISLQKEHNTYSRPLYLDMNKLDEIPNQNIKIQNKSLNIIHFKIKPIDAQFIESQLPNANTQINFNRQTYPSIANSNLLERLTHSSKNDTRNRSILTYDKMKPIWIKNQSLQTTYNLTNNIQDLNIPDYQNKSLNTNSLKKENSLINLKQDISHENRGTDNYLKIYSFAVNSQSPFGKAFLLENQQFKENPNSSNIKGFDFINEKKLFVKNATLPSKVVNLIQTAKEFPLRAEIHLSPKSLGSIFVEINIINEKLDIMFKAENKDTLQILESQVVLLREKLTSLGFEKQNFAFTLNNEKEPEFTGYSNSKHHSHEERTLLKEFIRSFGMFKNDELKENFEKYMVKND
ncbi:MAG: flagellar hook-length control protein FliK, partial [Ignavibacteria bacterium]|nr:flagellar hook-length control protein FliK [Ignavibacteria bacterium]